MSNFGINDGHTLRGAGTGAEGIIRESEHTRLVGEELRRILRERGNVVHNCTVDYASTTSESLSLVVQQANREDLDWFIAIHFNAGGGRGVEVYTYEGRQYQDAIDVCNGIAALGFNNRGVKAGTGLYVIRKTIAKSMLIEVCFVDTDDANKYLSVGHTAIAKAIADALDSHVNSNPTPAPQPAPSKPAGNDWVRRLQAECNRQGFSNQVVDGIPGPATLAGCPLVKKGARGNITRLIQEKVRVTVDGIFGGNTKAAVIGFQNSHGLSPDGDVGQNTWRKMIGL